MENCNDLKLTISLGCCSICPNFSNCRCELSWLHPKGKHINSHSHFSGTNFRKQIAGGSIIAVAFSIANIIGPQTFQQKDAKSNYYPARVTLVATTASAIVVAVLLRILYGYRNVRAERLGEPAMSHIEATAVRGRTSVDFADPGYRYAY
jgi:hypothetical protein